ncbi:MAG TPA: aminotransferase class I/II-fold pyridoxal phosphate-dependent enzyme [Candidatus Acidoferrales bacterium]|nr:aminotransferase class I/II-fold pyridoxal phosphate-dependent enzyme [Candidatus Acidoferrales bacterium]
MAFHLRSLRAAGGLAFDPRAGVELSPIKDIELRASRIPGVVSLAQGIPSFDTPEPIKHYVQQKIAEGACAKYSVTPGLPELRELISETLLREGMQYDPDGEVLVTCGAIEAITATLLAAVGPGDEVLLTSPTYASYLPAVRLTGAEPRFVPLDEDANFDLDPDAIARAVSRRTRAILVCNPNNPTGTVFSREQVRRMLEIAQRHNLLVICDEVYKDFVYSDVAPANPAAFPAHRDGVVSIWSFSKAYAMTGWRIGFLVASRARVTSILKVHDALVTCAPVVSQHAAIAALQLGAPFIQQFRAEFRARRDRIIERLDQLPHVFDYQHPNASYFVFPRIKDTVPLARDSRRLATDILERAHVAVVPGAAFGPTGEAHLRLCYARTPQEIDVACDRLQDYFAGRASQTRVQIPVIPRAKRSPARQFGVTVLRTLARVYLKRRRPRVVVIAGSRGKTVMKRLLTELLSAHFKARANPLSHNTEVGVPLAVLDRSLDTRRSASIVATFVRSAWTAVASRAPLDVLVLELGVRHRGEMAEHLRIVRPDIAVITGLAPSYSEDQQALAVLRAEIAELCAAVRGAGGHLLLCGDDPSLAALACTLPGAVLFSKSHLREDAGQRRLEIDGVGYAVGRETVGESSIYGIEAAIRVGKLLGVSDAALAGFAAHPL